MSIPSASRSSIASAPNPRLQRTRYAPLRSPLSRKPLGGMWRIAAVLPLVFSSRLLHADSLDRQIEYQCPGLEDFEIRVAYHVDAGGGSIRSRDGKLSIALAVGPMIAESIPSARRSGLRWMKTEQVGNATLRYGYDPKKRLLEATIRGSRMNSIVNLAAFAKDQDQFLMVARTLVGSPCKSQLATERSRNAR